MDHAAMWRERAQHSYRVLTAASVRGRGRWRRVREPGRHRRVALWPLSQLLWCASVMAATGRGGAEPGVGDRQPDIDLLWDTLRWYRRGDALVDNRPRGQFYYDDNAWIGLVAAQQAQLTHQGQWWQRAADTARFLQSGCTPDGGVLWVHRGTTVNACSTGAAGLLFAAVATSQAVDIRGREQMLERAEAAAQFLHTRLLRSDGLISDHVRADGSIEPSVWTYNQGLAVALFDRTDHRAWADELVAAVERGMPVAVRHSQPAAFTAVWYRTLLARDPVGWPPGLDEYLDMAWREGRDKQNLFRHVDRYDDGLLIDHAAITGLMAAAAASPRVRTALL